MVRAKTKVKKTSLEQALGIAREHDKGLLATDFDSNSFVLINHQDGSTFLMRSAFLAEWREYVVVFTEHGGTFVYPKGDLLFWQQFTEDTNIRRLKGARVK